MSYYKGTLQCRLQSLFVTWLKTPLQLVSFMGILCAFCSLFLNFGPEILDDSYRVKDKAYNSDMKQYLCR